MDGENRPAWDSDTAAGQGPCLHVWGFSGCTFIWRFHLSSLCRWVSPWSPSCLSCKPPSWKLCRIPAVRWGWGLQRLWASWFPSTPRWTLSSPSSCLPSEMQRIQESGEQPGSSLTLSILDPISIDEVLLIDAIKLLLILWVSES